LYYAFNLFLFKSVRILHINSANSFAGGERHLVDLTRGLIERGHELYVATRPRSPLRCELAEHLPAANLIELPLRNALDLESARRLARFISTHKIEIVHAHVARDYLLAAFAIRRARRGGARLVITRHLLFPLNRFTALVLRQHAACIISVSEAVARVLREQNIIPGNMIRVILNGVDTEAFAHAGTDNKVGGAELFAGLLQSSLAAKQFVGIAGELRPHKGQEDFVRAASIVAARFPNACFIITGEDPTARKEFRTRLEHLIAEFNLSDRIHLTGWIENVRDFFAGLDVFVSASRVEPFGLVIVEAMASGAGVVATATDGAIEIIDDGLTGKLVPVGDWEAMANAVGEFLSDENLRRQFGERARVAARERFSLNRMADETENIYREVLNAS
jgi:L-malate glycosyltransferase